ncbi:MAG: hypothetical protein K6C12_03995 [Oscillospiraceae bacterium]|nr:hypothetical protein [Oscillospiraceae bacterium]
MREKRIPPLVKRVIVLLLMVLLTGNSSAFAASGKAPGPEDLTEIQSGIEYPTENEYLENYQYATVKAPKGHSVLGFGSADHQGSGYTVLDGEKVMILAVRGGYSCVIVLSQNKGRWINSDYLIPSEEEDPGSWKMLSSSTVYGDSLTEYEYFFNEDGLIDRETCHKVNRDGTEQWTEQLRTYDDDGRLVRSETRDLETGDLVDIRVFSFTPEKKLRQVCTYDWSGNLRTEQNNTYSADKRTLEVIEYDDNGNISRRYVSESDLDNNPLQTASYDSHGQCTSRTETIYNAAGEKEMEIYYDASGEAWLSMEFSHTYNERGQVTETRSVYVDSILAGKERVIRYTYDEYGNLTEEAEIYDGEPTYTKRSSWGLMKNGQIVQVSE